MLVGTGPLPLLQTEHAPNIYSVPSHRLLLSSDGLNSSSLLHFENHWSFLSASCHILSWLSNPAQNISFHKDSQPCLFCRSQDQSAIHKSPSLNPMRTATSIHLSGRRLFRACFLSVPNAAGIPVQKPALPRLFWPVSQLFFPSI